MLVINSQNKLQKLMRNKKTLYIIYICKKKNPTFLVSVLLPLFPRRPGVKSFVEFGLSNTASVTRLKLQAENVWSLPGFADFLFLGWGGFSKS